MLDYKLIEYKQKIHSKNDDIYLDLLSKSYNPNITLRGYPTVVNKYYVARPDLISLAAYGDDSYADIICKINGISNPFELNEDDIIFIPSFEYIRDFTKNYGEKSELVEDPKTDEIIPKNKDDYRKQKNDDRTPNDMVIGESNFVIDRSLGLVFY